MAGPGTAVAALGLSMEKQREIGVLLKGPSWLASGMDTSVLRRRTVDGRGGVSSTSV